MRTLAETYASGHTMRFHDHQWHQLVFASAGVLAVDVGDDTWIVPPERAVWVPAGTRHRLSARTRASLRTVYFEPSFAPGRAAVAVVAVDALLRELILRVVSLGMLDVTRPDLDRLGRVLLDQLVDIEVLPLRVTRPGDPLASAAAELLSTNPAMSLDAVADVVGTSRRSLERRFVAGVGVPLGQWRQRVRLARALELLAAGESVTKTGTTVGYSTTSAFIDAFRREFGATPARYFTAVRAS